GTAAAAGAPAPGDREAPLHEPGDLGEVLDARARQEYRRRLDHLDAEISAADGAGDAQRSEQAHAERAAIATQLSAAPGLGGRSRRPGHPAERARTAVTARIHDAIGKIEGIHPDLGAHLRRSVRTGALCVYDPEVPQDWIIRT